MDYTPSSTPNPINFVDHRAFDTNFGPEMEILAQIETMLVKAEEFVQVPMYSNTVYFKDLNHEGGLLQ